MSLFKPETPFQIVLDPFDDVRINYKPWLACIFAIAASAKFSLTLTVCLWQRRVQSTPRAERLSNDLLWSPKLRSPH
jgi:hypothetical protein